MSDESDYVMVGVTTDPHKFVAIIMVYQPHLDGYAPSKVSEALPMVAAVGLARSWAAAKHLELRGNILIDAAHRDVQALDFLTLRNHPIIRQIVDGLIGVLDQFPAIEQQRGLAIVSGMLFGEIDGHPTDADTYGQFVTFEDRKRIYDAMQQRAYEWVMGERAKREKGKAN